MTVDIQVTQDENFKINTVKFGEQFLASDGERVAIAETPEIAIEKIEKIEEIQQVAVETHRGPRPAALENHRSTNAGSFFGGTAWGTDK